MKGVKKDVFPTAAGRDFREGIFKAIVSLEFRNNGLFDVRGAANRCILGLALFERRNSRVFNMLRGIKVGLASSKIDDLNPLAAERRDFHRDHEGRRWFDLIQTWCQTHSFLHSSCRTRGLRAVQTTTCSVIRA